MAAKKHVHRGDGGMTSVLGGISVPKSDPLIAAIGDVDELDAHIAHIGDLLKSMGLAEPCEFLTGVGRKMWRIKSIIARPPDPATPRGSYTAPTSPRESYSATASPTSGPLPSPSEPPLSPVAERKKIEDADVVDLERRIDAMDAELRPLSNFILMGGNPLVSFIHITRTVCRRAERSLVAIDRAAPIGPNIVKYINRLSLYLFSLSRWVARQLGVEEDIVCD